MLWQTDTLDFRKERRVKWGLSLELLRSQVLCLRRTRSRRPDFYKQQKQFHGCCYLGSALYLTAPSSSVDMVDVGCGRTKMFVDDRASWRRLDKTEQRPIARGCCNILWTSSHATGDVYSAMRPSWFKKEGVSGMWKVCEWGKGLTSPFVWPSS